MINDLIRDAILKQIVNRLMKYTISKAAFLSWGPLASILEIIFNKILGKALDFGIVELGVAMTKLEINQSVEKVQNISRRIEQGEDLDEELENAYLDLIAFKHG